ncbi:MAG: SGNH/GDSL hydrolase family protein [Clostridia bacterium]|nr:SGNH/GDSL hydrolase family protein [Clostridia bacterium]
MFNRNNMLIPVWDTDMMYAEALTFVDGKSILMYEPEEIISLYDSHLKNEYKLGVDFTVNGRDITLNEGSPIFSFTSDELYPAEPVPGHSFPMGNKNILFYEEHFFHDRQYAVTYKIKENTWNGHRPKSARPYLPKTFEKLDKGAPLNITLFGDSISVGANASGFTGAEPYLPPYADLFVQWLESRYGSKIDFHNPSVGGKDSQWGVDTVEENVNFRQNDLVIVALGGNDSFTEPEKLVENFRAIIGAIRAKYPETEFVVTATSYANELLKDSFCGNQMIFSEYMDALVEPGIAKADMTSMQRELLKHKRYIDVTGNNINHPNDFFHRMHAQYYIEMFR